MNRGPLTQDDFNCLDLQEVVTIELRIDRTGKVWFNVNGECLFRAGSVQNIEVNDDRSRDNQGGFNGARQGS